MEGSWLNYEEEEFAFSYPATSFQVLLSLVGPPPLVLLCSALQNGYVIHNIKYLPQLLLLWGTFLTLLLIITGFQSRFSFLAGSFIQHAYRITKYQISKSSIFHFTLPIYTKFFTFFSNKVTILASSSFLGPVLFFLVQGKEPKAL